MSDDPGFRRETHSTVEPSAAELVAHYLAQLTAAEKQVAALLAEIAELEERRMIARSDSDGFKSLYKEWRERAESAERMFAAAVWCQSEHRLIVDASELLHDFELYRHTDPITRAIHYTAVMTQASPVPSASEATDA